MSKGFKILIIDNGTGDVLVNYPEAKCIIGGIQVGDMSHAIGFVHGSPVDVAYAISACQKSIAAQTEDHPEINFIAAMIAKDENDGGEDDDE